MDTQKNNLQHINNI